VPRFSKAMSLEKLGNMDLAAGKFKRAASRFKQCREVWLTNLYKSDDCEKGIQSLLKATKSRNKKLHKKLKAMFGDIDVLAKVYEKTTNDWVSQFPAQAKSVTISPEGKPLDGFFKHIGSQSFRDNYFEKLPVVMNVGIGNNEMSLLPTLKKVLKQKYLYFESKDKSKPTVSMFPGNFYTHTNPLNLQQGQEIGKPELLGGLKEKQTTIFNSVQAFAGDVWAGATDYTRRLSETQGMWSNTNMYLTAPNVKQSMEAHNDIQCTFIAQLEGKKRWRIWLPSSLMLTDSWLGRNVGKNPENRIDTSKLGEPYMDVVLTKGQIMYVPRGAVHMTSTPKYKKGEQDSGPSMHLTGGVEFNDHNMEAPAVGTSGIEVLNPNSPLFSDKLHRAFQRAVDKMRTNPRALLRGSMDVRGWQKKGSLGKQLRGLLVETVDAMLDDGVLEQEILDEIAGRLKENPFSSI